MDIRIQCLCIDTADPAKIASFWESALGWHRTWEEEDQVCLEPPEVSIVPDLIFLKVPAYAPHLVPDDVPAEAIQAESVAFAVSYGVHGRTHQ
jgi:Glyoxalase-like domain